VLQHSTHHTKYMYASVGASDSLVRPDHVNCYQVMCFSLYMYMRYLDDETYEERRILKCAKENTDMLFCALYIQRLMRNLIILLNLKP